MTSTDLLFTVMLTVLEDGTCTLPSPLISSICIRIIKHLGNSSVGYNCLKVVVIIKCITLFNDW